MKKVIVIVLAFALILPLANAQKIHHKKQINPEAKKEMKALFQNEVLPVMNEKLQEFDKQLTVEDLKFIQGKRREATALKVERKSKHEKMKALHDSNISREEMKETMRAFHKSMKPFMERNKDLITASMESLKSHHENWRTAKKDIKEKYAPEGATGRGDEDHPGKERKEYKEKSRKDDGKMEGRNGRQHRKGRRGMRGMPGKGKHGALGFVLWDGKAMNEDAILRDTENATDLFPNVNQNYPNPANRFTIIEFDLPKDTKEVNLTITDMNGKTIKAMNLGALTAGQHQQQIEVTGFQNGNYFYIIETDGVKMTKKMMVVK